MKHIILTLFFSLCLTSHLSSAIAEDGSQNFLSLGLGYYDILDDDGAADVRLEYRSGHEYFWKIKPWAGVEVTSDTSLWLGGGVLADIDIHENWILTPSFGAGFYAQGSSDLDLGHPIEFRSQIELAYELPSASRVGLSFGHLSNASLDDSNPGTEVLNLYYHVPIAELF